MSKKKIVPLILSGGSGSRLWPLSRESLPKQFLPLFEEKTLFHKTLSRLKKFDKLSLVSHILSVSKLLFFFNDQLVLNS